MSDDVVRRVEGLGNRYRIRHQQQGGVRYKALRDVLADTTKSVGKRLWSLTSVLRPPSSEDFWSLKEVFFQVRQGETFGISGRNDAGKITLRNRGLLHDGQTWIHGHGFENLPA